MRSPIPSIFHGTLAHVPGAIVLIGVCLCASSAAAQMPKSGAETLIHDATTQNESEASVALDAQGNYAVAYTHLDNSGNNGVAVRRFDHQGQALGTATVPHVNTIAIQQQPAIAMADDGRFVVTWEDNASRGGNNYDVFFSLYNAGGALEVGPVRVNSNTSGVRENPRVAMNRLTGDFVVVFAGGASQGATDVFFRRFSNLGLPLEAVDQKVNSSSNQQDFAPSVAFSANGTFVVTWEGNPNDDAGFEAYFQRYSFGTVSATALGGNTAASATGHDSTEVEVAADESGNFVLGWVDGLPANHTDPKDLLFRRYNGSGGALTSITVMKPAAYSGNGTSLVPRIRLAMENDEDFIATYMHNDEIYGKFFNSSGTIKGSEIPVNTTSTPDLGEFQSKPWVGINPIGTKAVVVWNGRGASDANGVHLQRFFEPEQSLVPGWETY